MEIQALGYVGVGASDLTDWTDFATNWLGMQMVERGNSVRAFRMDDRQQRLVVDRAIGDNHRYFGFEVADAASLQSLATRLEAAGVAVRREPKARADQRRVADLISFADPEGNQLEAYHGAAVADSPFRPGRTISGFRTGVLGMGHVAFTVLDLEGALAFYRDLLGFHISDWMLSPFHGYWMHVNARHHTLALIQSRKRSIHHVMVELFSLDDVGQGYDIALGEPEKIATTLGRHTNDAMTSYYLNSPGGFMMECGWGGLEVTPGSWQPRECTHGPSLWGHERSWLPPEGRQRARDLRLNAAAEGQREPVRVIDGNYTRMSGVCPWWDAVKAAW